MQKSKQGKSKRKAPTPTQPKPSQQQFTRQGWVPVSEWLNPRYTFSPEAEEAEEKQCAPKASSPPRKKP